MCHGNGVSMTRPGIRPGLACSIAYSPEFPFEFLNSFHRRDLVGLVSDLVLAVSTKVRSYPPTIFNARRPDSGGRAFLLQ